MELLIVIVVIAILAAISIVAYTGIQSRARNAAVEADRAAIMKGVEVYRVQEGGNNVPSTEQDLATVGLSAMADRMVVNDGMAAAWPVTPNATGTPKGKINYIGKNHMQSGYSVHDLSIHWWDYQQGVWVGYREITYDNPDIASRKTGPKPIRFYDESNDWMGEPCTRDYVEQCSPVAFQVSD